MNMAIVSCCRIHSARSVAARSAAFVFSVAAFLDASSLAARSSSETSSGSSSLFLAISCSPSTALVFFAAALSEASSCSSFLLPCFVSASSVASFLAISCSAVLSWSEPRTFCSFALLFSFSGAAFLSHFAASSPRLSFCLFTPCCPATDASSSALSTAETTASFICIAFDSSSSRGFSGGPPLSGGLTVVFLPITASFDSLTSLNSTSGFSLRPPLSGGLAVLVFSSMTASFDSSASPDSTSCDLASWWSCGKGFLSSRLLVAPPLSRGVDLLSPSPPSLPSKKLLELANVLELVRLSHILLTLPKLLLLPLLDISLLRSSSLCSASFSLFILPSNAALACIIDDLRAFFSLAAVCAASFSAFTLSSNAARACCMDDLRANFSFAAFSSCSSLSLFSALLTLSPSSFPLSFCFASLTKRSSSNFSNAFSFLIFSSAATLVLSDSMAFSSSFFRSSSDCAAPSGSNVCILSDGDSFRGSFSFSSVFGFRSATSFSAAASAGGPSSAAAAAKPALAFATPAAASRRSSRLLA
mmetsp:Transcript_21403/g.45745  ORF Transcript_21403/g.45745 Transcript_21403/m.45745 type:complete len:531 (+) Transcript_21403:552-2144(+)